MELALNTAPQPKASEMKPFSSIRSTPQKMARLVLRLKSRNDDAKQQTRLTRPMSTSKPVSTSPLEKVISSKAIADGRNPRPSARKGAGCAGVAEGSGGGVSFMGRQGWVGEA